MSNVRLSDSRLNQMGCPVAKGNIKMRDLSVPSLLSLLDVNSAESKHLIQHVSSYNNYFALTSFGTKDATSENNLQNSG